MIGLHGEETQTEKFTLHYNTVQEQYPVVGQAAGECTFLIILV